MAGRPESVTDQRLSGLPDDTTREPRVARELAELSEAVRAHEWVSRGRSVPKRPVDHELYQRLEEIELALSKQPTNGSEG